MSFLIHFVISFTWFTVFEMILFFTNVLVFFRYGLPFRKPHRLLDFLPSVAMLIAIVSFLFGDTTLLALVFYGVTLIVFLCTIKSVFKRSKSEPRFKLGRALFCGAGIIVLLSTPTYAGELRYNPVSEFSEMSYSQAFVQLNSRLSREYPFGEWKQVNWQGLQEKYEPLFKKAEEEKTKIFTTKRCGNIFFPFEMVISKSVTKICMRIIQYLKEKLVAALASARFDWIMARF